MNVLTRDGKGNDIVKMVKIKEFQTKEVDFMKKTEDIVIPYETLTITFKNGNKVVYGKDEWNDYRYTENAIAVIDEYGAWKSIYNFDDVFSVELESQTDK